MLKLSDKWVSKLLDLPETGMDYQIVTVILKDGRQFKQVANEGGFITKIKGQIGIPFSEDEIENIIVTHDKWDWNKG
jgi:hypothetical protein